jgi:hypothetical protein
MLLAASGRLIDGSRRHRTASEIRPTGTFTKKIQFQLTRSVIKPPIHGPSTDDSPNTAPNSPRYLPRSTGV